jgi:hypothetical protein
MSEHERSEEEVIEEARALREVAAKLEQHVGDLVAREVQTVAVPRTRFRSIVLALVLGGLLVIFLAGAWNRVTLQQAQQQAQRDVTFQVVNCFLRPGSNTPAQAAECARRNGGEVYSRRQQESAEATRRFQDLQRWAEAHGWSPPTTTTTTLAQ